MLDGKIIENCICPWRCNLQDHLLSRWLLKFLGGNKPSGGTSADELQRYSIWRWNIQKSELGLKLTGCTYFIGVMRDPNPSRYSNIFVCSGIAHCYYINFQRIYIFTGEHAIHPPLLLGRCPHLDDRPAKRSSNLCSIFDLKKANFCAENVVFPPKYVILWN